MLSWSGSFESGHGAVIKELLDTAPCPLLLVPSDAPAPDAVVSRRPRMAPAGERRA